MRSKQTQLEIEGTDKELKMIQATENMETVCNEKPTQSTVHKVLKRKEPQRKTQNQENHYEKIRIDQQKTR